jgi:signal transduction histidine kinase
MTRSREPACAPRAAAYNRVVNFSALRRSPLALVFLVWTVEGLLWTGQTQLAARLDGKDWPLAGVLLVQMGTAYAWALGTLVILALARRFRFERSQWPRSLGVHLGVSLAMSFVINLLFVCLQQVSGRTDLPPSPILVQTVRLFVGWFDFNLLIYWAILVGSYALDHYRKLREREVRALELETQLARARLDALEMQLHPHFLFNALHTISALVRSNQNALAVRVVAGLGDLLRAALDRTGEAEIPLRRELEFIQRYLDIEQIRFGDRLTVAVAADPGTLDARVPTLLLQPLVENAVRHGIAPRAAAGRIEVRAWREDGWVFLRVRDDGAGLPEGFDLARDGGVGLNNTRERLGQLYGDRHTFTVGNASGGGVAVDVSLPYRLALDDWHG